MVSTVVVAVTTTARMSVPVDSSRDGHMANDESQARDE
jgi:hypothetical protein